MIRELYHTSRNAKMETGVFTLPISLIKTLRTVPIVAKAIKKIQSSARLLQWPQEQSLSWNYETLSIFLLLLRDFLLPTFRMRVTLTCSSLGLHMVLCHGMKRRNRARTGRHGKASSDGKPSVRELQSPVFPLYFLRRGNRDRKSHSRNMYCGVLS